MKVILGHYTHEVNGLRLRIIAETDAEAELLDAMWEHGKMETGHPGGDKAYGGSHLGKKAYMVCAFSQPRTVAKCAHCGVELKSDDVKTRVGRLDWHCEDCLPMEALGGIKKAGSNGSD